MMEALKSLSDNPNIRNTLMLVSVLFQVVIFLILSMTVICLLYSGHLVDYVGRVQIRTILF